MRKVVWMREAARVNQVTTDNFFDFSKHENSENEDDENDK